MDAQRQGLVVLLGEADLAQRDPLERDLAAAGYKVVVAGDGEDALERFRTARPDAVVLAAALPRLRGLEVARRMKSLRRDAFVPVVLLIGEPGVDARIEGLRGGADAVLGRPPHPEELRAHLEALLRIRPQLQPAASPGQSGRGLRAATLPSPPGTGAQAAPVASVQSFGARVAEELRRAQEQSEPLALLLVSREVAGGLDAPGDTAAQSAALVDIVRRVARPLDMVAPAGYRSVGALCLGTQLGAAVDLAERILVEAGPQAGAASAARVGVALFPGREVETAEDLYRLARQALQRAVGEGRGCICLSLNRQVYVVNR